jgi:hypothetical protein
MKKIAIFLLFGILLYACKKEAGEGGTSIIEGKVYQLSLWDNSGVWDTLEYKLVAEKEIGRAHV